jgi:hypothetical protein
LTKEDAAVPVRIEALLHSADNRFNAARRTSMPALRSEEAFTRFEIQPRVYETICFGCHRILGYATNVSGLEILEKVHNCYKESIRLAA